MMSHYLISDVYFQLMLKFKMTTTPDVTSMMASVEDLQIQRCYFNTDQRQTSAVSMVMIKCHQQASAVGY